MRTAQALAVTGLMVVVCASYTQDSRARSKRRTGPSRSAQPFSLTAADGTGLRLVALRAKVVVDGPLAFTELHLTFRNPENRQREGRFTITLPPTAAISRLAMKIDGRWQEGEVVERQRAHRIYESYLHVKRDPALLEKAAGNTFQARIFPIAARANKELRISYSEELASSRRPYRLRLRGLPRISRLRIRALVHRRAGRRLRWRVHRLSRNRYTPRRDFTLALRTGISGLRHGDLAVLRVSPRIPARWRAMPSLLVLLDSSASQAFEFSQQVKHFGRIVEAITRRHGRGLRLKVATFDQSVQPVYQGPSGGFGARQLRRVRKRGAFGASNLEAALSWASRQQGYTRLLLVTDGIATAGATKARLGRVLARARGRILRVDALAAGYTRDETQLQGLVTGVLPNDGVLLDDELTPARIAERMGQTVRTRVGVSVPGARWVWPRHLDSLQPGSEALIYVRLRRGQRKAPRALTVRLDGYLKQRLRVRLHATERPLVERAWVRSRIEWLSSLDYSASVTKRIIKLSKRHRVLSESTALLVLENDAEYRTHGLHRGALSNILTVGRRGLVLVKRSRGWYKRNVVVDRSSQRKPSRRIVAPKQSTVKPTHSYKGRDGFWELALGRGDKPKPPSKAQRRKYAGGSRLYAMRSPTVFCSGEEMSGGLDAATIGRDIRRFRRGVRHCYQLELQARPGLEGMVKLAFTIRLDGRVGIAKIVNSTLNNRNVESCILRQTRKWQFPLSDARSRPYVVYPYRFTTRSMSRLRARRAARRARIVARRKLRLRTAYGGELLRLKRLLRAKRHRQALALARRWQARSPKSLLALVGLGEALQGLGRLREAARVYGSLIDLHPSRAEIRRYAGSRLGALGNIGLRLALDTHTKALALRPDHAHGYRLLAFTQTRLGRLNRALATLEKGLRRRYPAGRFAGVKSVLRADLGLVARAILKRHPRRRSALTRRLKRHQAKIATGPSVRAVLTWEADANDMTLHVGAAQHTPQGALYKDVTNGFGPECVVLPKIHRRVPQPVRVTYTSRGPMGFGLGTVSVLRHDGRGGLRFSERPFVIMKDGGTIALGTLRPTGANPHERLRAASTK